MDPNDFIQACKIMGKPEGNSKCLGFSSTANKMSYSIKNVANVYNVMLGDKEERKRAEIDAFLKKVQVLWHSSISNTIAETQARIRRNKQIKLPKDSQ